MVVGRNRHFGSSQALLTIGISGALVFMLGLFGLNVAPPVTDSQAATYGLPVTGAASVGVTLDKTTVDLGTLGSTALSGTNTATVDTNSVAGYTITQTFDDAAATTATSSSASTSAAGGTAKWTPSGTLKLDRTGATNTLRVAVTHSFGTLATDTTNNRYTEPNTFTYTVNTVDTTSTPAGTYKATAKYSVVANLPAAPTLTSVSPTELTVGSVSGNLTLTGTNLASVYQVYLGDTNSETSRCVIDTSVARTATTLACKAPTELGGGEHAIHLVYQGGEATTTVKVNYIKKSICTNADPDSECTVDIDANMIPIKYAGNPNGDDTPKWVVADPSVKGDWYNYGNKKWANAVTVKKEDLTKYSTAGDVEKSGQAPVSGYYKAGTVVSNDDVLGYYVYIPRYKYKVQTMIGSTTPTASNFDISFERNSVAKSVPSAVGDWATHPAFTWGSTELNGFWMGKFETTGKISEPTIKPNQVANVNNTIGEQFTSAASIGVDDPIADTMGSSVSGVIKNSHKMSTAKSHMLKSSEWGAAAYLSASNYGAGVNNVKNNGVRNSNNNTDADGDIANSNGGAATGCGPSTATSDSSVPQQSGVKPDATTFENDRLCETSSTDTTNADTTNAYNQSHGVLASTTNNVYGVYDMAGGMWEYVMGNWTDKAGTAHESTYDYAKGSIGKGFSEPYIDFYLNPSSDSSCTWATCGGAALYETKSWGSDYSIFVGSSSPWFKRGGYANLGSDAGVFALDINAGSANDLNGFRVGVLVPASPQ